MGYRSLNLDKVPMEMGRPIVPTVRNIIDWDFVWTVPEDDVVQATLDTPYGVVALRWTNIDDHWGVTFVQCPVWQDDGRRGPSTSKGVQRWLINNKIPKTKYAKTL